MNKKELRKIYLERRNTFTQEQCHAMSISISEHFFNHFKISHSSSIYLHLFLPIIEKKELNTFIIFERILADFPNIKVALSKSDFTNYSMQFFEYTKEIKLIENSYGIPEPVGGNLVKPEQLDYALIPLLVADEKGNRIGYGKGFYDRFLANCRADCTKIGLSFEKPIERIVSDLYDIPLDFCVTPEKIYDFRKV